MQLLLTYRGTAIRGVIFTGSSDGSSLIVRFNGTLGPYINFMPLLKAGDGYQDMIEGVNVGIMTLVELPANPDVNPRVWVHRQVSTAGDSVASRDEQIH
jgi:hypothetical protein